MRQPQFSLNSPLPIHPPNCWKCNMPMWLVRIDPGDTPDHDRRIFECFECAETETVVVRYR
jgi:hypothetical protein